jgi:hypothetical protein
MLMIGDGVLGMIGPRDHCRLWALGSGRWAAAVDWFAAHPRIVRTVAAAELVAGLWLAERQYRPIEEAE